MTDLQEAIVNWLGTDNPAVTSSVRHGFGRVYDGFLVTDEVCDDWGAGDAASIVRECERRKLILAVVSRSDELPLPNNERIFRVPPQHAAARKELDRRGVRVHRLVRVVADGDDLLSTVVVSRIVSDVQNAAPAFVAASDQRHDDKRLPTVEKEGIEWRADDPEERDLFPVGRLLLPIIRGATLVEGAAGLKTLLDSLCLDRRINITPAADLITGTGILGAFIKKEVQPKACDNIRDAFKFIDRHWPGSAIARKGLFDDKSGAIYCSPSEWRELKTQSGSPQREQLVKFFDAPLEDIWSPAHPCRRRVLWTPTKLLLRGESYYINMRKLSAFKRFQLLLDEMGDVYGLLGKLHPHTNDVAEDAGNWRLMLALLDQMRNISLQIYSFLHAAEALLRGKEIAFRIKGLWGDRKDFAHAFLAAAIRAYYSWLLRETADAQSAINDATHCFSGMTNELAEINDEIKGQFTADRRETSPELDDLVRGWREADHPGENLLTAVLAAERFASGDRPAAVGIGWGGIELPLVFNYAMSRMHERTESEPLATFIARYSHYRAEDAEPAWVSFPEAGMLPKDFAGHDAALFDDNALTGITLERVRDDLLLSGASKVHMFITRYSGERRHAHMQMDEHGAIDPDVLAGEIGGYVGETPFSRSWSRKKKDYKSHIGVFSLARRRILECIYNNSTVELYDREGF